MNAFTTPQTPSAPPALTPEAAGGTSAPGGAPGGPVGAPNMLGASAPGMEAPSGMGAPNPITPTKEQIKTQQRHTNVMVDVLTHLLGTPTGDLTKKDVFDGAADAIAKGAFPTPESQQQLIVEMANLPDDDPGLRKALSALLLQSATLKHVMAKTFGEG